MKKIFITYGDAGYEKAKDKICSQAFDTKQFDAIIPYGYDDISHELLMSEVIKEKRGGGLWSWKPDVILSTMNKYNEGDIIVYCDAGCSLYDSSEWFLYWKKLENHDILVQRIFQRTDQWTRREVLDYFNLNSWRLMKSFQFQATIVLKITPFTKKLIREWRDLMILHPEFVKDVAKDELAYQYPAFIENRHDQSVYSALIYKYLQNPLMRKKIYVQWEHIEDYDLINKQAIRATRLRLGQAETNKQLFVKSIKRSIKDFIFKPFYFAPLQFILNNFKIK